MSATNTKSSIQMQALMQTKTPLAVMFVSAIFAFSAHAQIPTNPLEAKVAAPVLAPTAVAPTSAVPAMAQAPVAQQQPAAKTYIQNTAAAMEIQRINENMAVLQAQLSQLELQVKVASKKREITGLNSDAVQSSFDSKKGIPSVVSVAGLKGQLEAVLVFPGNYTQRVKVGDIIDDRRVVKVAANEVILSDLKGTNTQRLTFGTTAVIRETMNVQNTGQVR